MSSARFLLFGNSLFSTPSRCRPFFPLSPFLSLPSLSFQFHCYSSSTIAADTLPDNPGTLGSLQRHPWPEWVTFVDRLKTKGYFIDAPTPTEVETNISNDATTVSPENIYTDMNQLKDPCLLFARHRFDIFKSFSIDDIETLVKGGCPNLLRKIVNSAKRLRLYAHLDEGDVCSACNLRGSCDRAYVIPKNHEAEARTVDLVRILLFHALDPLVISGGVKSSDRELVEASARKLLSQLIDLSDIDLDPALLKPMDKVKHEKDQEHAVNFSEPPYDVEMKRGDWMCPKCNFMNFSRNVVCRQCKEGGPKKVGTGQVEMKEGDWICSKCHFVNFSRNLNCKKCNEEHPKQVGAHAIEKKKGDWICSKCDFMNFSRNIKCLKCKEEGPKRVSVDDVERKKGDWNCVKCGFLNFASNRMCLRCRDPRPQMKPGEWECPSCNFLNWARNAVCLKCNCERPKEATKDYEEQFWKSHH